MWFKLTATSPDHHRLFLNLSRLTSIELHETEARLTVLGDGVSRSIDFDDRAAAEEALAGIETKLGLCLPDDSRRAITRY